MTLAATPEQLIRNQVIEDVLGIVPDERLNGPVGKIGSVGIPAQEKLAAILATQTGESGANERLLSLTITWAYDSLANYEMLNDRPDLQTEDIMQIGVLATLEAAQKVSPDVKDPIAEFARFRNRAARYLIQRSGFIKSPGEQPAPPFMIELMSGDELEEAVNSDRERVLTELESQVFESPARYRKAAARLLEGLDPEEAEHLRDYYGIATPEERAALRERLGASNQALSAHRSRLINKLAGMPLGLSHIDNVLGGTEDELE